MDVSRERAQDRHRHRHEQRRREALARHVAQRDDHAIAGGAQDLVEIAAHLPGRLDDRGHVEGRAPRRRRQADGQEPHLDFAGHPELPRDGLQARVQSARHVAESTGPSRNPRSGGDVAGLQRPRGAEQRPRLPQEEAVGGKPRQTEARERPGQEDGEIAGQRRPRGRAGRPRRDADRRGRQTPGPSFVIHAMANRRSTPSTPATVTSSVWFCRILSKTS